MTDQRKYFRLNTDGGVVAARGQASGEAAIGVVLTDPSGEVVHEVSDRIGLVDDHHIAEYRALIAGLRLAAGHGVLSLRAFSDSRMVVNQVKHESRVGARYLPYWWDAEALAGQFDEFDIDWIPRKDNKRANELASRALLDLKK